MLSFLRSYFSRILFALVFLGTLCAFYFVAAVGTFQNGRGGGELEEDFPAAFFANLVTAGTPDVPVATVEYTQPAEDTIRLDGASYVITEGDTLTPFPADYYMSNASTDFYVPDAGIFLSTNDQFLDSSDTVITSAALTSFDAVPLSGAYTYSAVGWVDNVNANGEYDQFEDMFEIYANGDQISDGDQLREFSAADTIAYESEVGEIRHAVFIDDADSDGFESGGDSVVTGGIYTPLTLFAPEDGVCFDQTAGADLEYDNGDVIWWNAGEDCSSFDTGVDVILVGDAPIVGVSTSASDTGSLAFIDFDEDGVYTCSRDDCEIPLYYGPGFTEGELESGATFFDASTDVTDGITSTGISWNEASYSVNVGVESLAGGELRFLYIDTDESGTFTSLDAPIILSFAAGGGTDAATGQSIYLFATNDYKYLAPGDTQFLHNIQEADNIQVPLILSVNDTLDPGLLDGSGVDEVVIDGTRPLRAMEDLIFPHSYHDDNGNGSYEDGDDIVQVADSSNLYNADQLLSVVIDADEESNDLEDTDLDAIYIYRQVGAECIGEGVDTLVGSDESAPFLGETIAITDEIFTRSQSNDERTLCIFVDVSDAADPGTGLTLDFTSYIMASGVGPGGVISGGGDDEYDVVAEIPITISPDNTTEGELTTYSMSFTPGVDVLEDTNIGFFFPEEVALNLDDSSISCTADGVDLGGFGLVPVETVAFIQSVGAIAAGEEVVCEVTDVTNPPAGEYALVNFIHGGDPGRYYINSPATITTTELGAEPADTGGGRRPPRYRYKFVQPSLGNLYSSDSPIEITWIDNSSVQLPLADLYFRAHSSDDWALVAEDIANDGVELVVLPGVETSEAQVRLQGNDQFGEDVSGASVVSEGFGLYQSTEEPGDPDSPGETTDDQVDPDNGLPEPVVGCGDPYSISDTTCNEFGICVGDYIKYPGRTTVWEVGIDFKRHAFIREPIYFSYINRFSPVKELPREQVESVEDERSVLPQAGTVLVKMRSDRDVYYTKPTEDPYCHELFLIPDEQAASGFVGSNWADYVLDLPDGFIGAYLNNGRTVLDEDFEPLSMKGFKRRDSLVHE